MGNWADEAFDRLKAREGQEHEKKQIQATEREMIVAHAPNIWKALTQKISAEVGAFSQRRPGYLKLFSLEMHEGPELTVRSPERELTLLFEKGIPQIAVKLTDVSDSINSTVISEGTYRFVVHNGGVWLFDNQAMTLDQLVPKLLSTLV